MAGQRLQQRGKCSGSSSPLGTMTNPLHGLVQIPSRDPLEDRHHGPDPAPLPNDVGRGEQTIGVVPGLLLLPRGGGTVGKRRDRTDRPEEGVLIQHPQLGPVTLDPLRWGLLHHDLLTTTSMTATEKESMHPRQRRMTATSPWTNRTLRENAGALTLPMTVDSTTTITSLSASIGVGACQCGLT